ncbi:bifunctional riboflavin kinase/FAD synthetase [Halothiobacillus sp. DCM-1]|uniref:bifunctional riboflavin kinase/FAD synthetase n=1 Tax=Halothiobacillus sp. DCM-1 TaxID=3112558 RepID=UPI0032530D34
MTASNPFRIVHGQAARLDFPAGCVVTLGNFDGVHLGHQALIRAAAQAARERALPLVVMLFEPLPREFFHPAAPVARLTRLRERVSFIQAIGGVDVLWVLPFNSALAALSAEAFVTRLLVQRLRTRAIWIGDDFRFGHRRQGDFALLAHLGAQAGFTVSAAPTCLVGGERVSSTRIRAHLQAGELVAARDLLGRAMTLCGRVIHGDKRGRQLGFPTANIALHRRLSPLQGVFAVVMSLPDHQQFRGVANIGTRPTVDGQTARLEVHLFDFAESLYGQSVQVVFLARLRAEQKFESLDALVAQIRCDVVAAQDFFADEPNP